MNPVSSDNNFRSMSCNVATVVNNLVIEAVSKRVSRVLGMRQERLAYP